MKFNWTDVAQRLMDSGNRLTREEAQGILETNKEDLEALLSGADQLRKYYFDRKVFFCSITNVKSGGCSEDCKFCAQSASYSTESPVYPMLEVDEMVEHARLAHSAKATEFCLVSQGKGPRPGKDFDRILEAMSQLKDKGWMKRCVSLGEMSLEQIRELKAAGLQRTNHNLETSRAHFEKVCTTHTFQDRWRTLENLKAEGVEVCTGGHHRDG